MLLYTSLIISVKYIVDRNIWNVDLVNVLALFDLKNTNKYEHLFLNVLDFNVFVQTRLYEEYFKWLVLYKEFINQESDENSDENQQIQTTRSKQTDFSN